MAYTSFILHPDQLLGLKQVALQLQAQRGGKADTSQVLRELLDAVASGAELPPGLQRALADGMRSRSR